MTEAAPTDKIEPDAPGAAPPVVLTITEYSPLAAGLEELRRRYDVVFDLTTREGEEEARTARRELTTLRTSLEKKRVELKAPALERSRQIDAEAKAIREAIEAFEDPIDADIKKLDADREAAKDRKRKAIAEAMAATRRLIGETFAIPLGQPTDSASLRALRQKFVDVDVAQFGDLSVEADEAKSSVLARLAGAIQGEEVRASEAAAAAATRKAEAEQRTKEKAAADAKEAEERAAREQADAAERERLASAQAQLDADRAELERGRRELAEQREAQAKKDREQADREAAERQARAAEEEARMRAEIAAQTRLEQASPELLDCLRQWLLAEVASDMDLLIATKRERDRLLELFADIPTAQDSSNDR